MCNVYVLLLFIVKLRSAHDTCSEAKPDMLRTSADIPTRDRLLALLRQGHSWKHVCRDGAIPRSASMPPNWRFRRHKRKKIDKHVIEYE
jgi:hypothetical protein